MAVRRALSTLESAALTGMMVVASAPAAVVARKARREIARLNASVGNGDLFMV